MSPASVLTLLGKAAAAATAADGDTKMAVVMPRGGPRGDSFVEEGSFLGSLFAGSSLPPQVAAVAAGTGRGRSNNYAGTMRPAHMHVRDASPASPTDYAASALLELNHRQAQQDSSAAQTQPQQQQEQQPQRDASAGHAYMATHGYSLSAPQAGVLPSLPALKRKRSALTATATGFRQAGGGSGRGANARPLVARSGIIKRASRPRRSGGPTTTMRGSNGGGRGGVVARGSFFPSQQHLQFSWQWPMAGLCLCQEPAAQTMAAQTMAAQTMAAQTMPVAAQTMAGPCLCQEPAAQTMAAPYTLMAGMAVGGRSMLQVLRLQLQLAEARIHVLLQLSMSTVTPAPSY
jgi:hypothetical protein